MVLLSSESGIARKKIHLYTCMCIQKKLKVITSVIHDIRICIFLRKGHKHYSTVMSTCRALRHPSAGNVPADNLPPEKLNNSCNHPSVTNELKIAAGDSTPFSPCPSKASDPNPQMARFLMNEATASFPTLCSSFDPTVPTCTEEIWCCIGHQRNGP